MPTGWLHWGGRIPKDFKRKARSWLRLQCTTAIEETLQSCLNETSSQNANASRNPILLWRNFSKFDPHSGEDFISSKFVRDMLKMILAHSKVCLTYNESRMMRTHTWITTTMFLSPLLPPPQPGAFSGNVRIQWPKGNQSSLWTSLPTTLAMHPMGSAVKQLSAFYEFLHSISLANFGKEAKR